MQHNTQISTRAAACALAAYSRHHDSYNIFLRCFEFWPTFDLIENFYDQSILDDHIKRGRKEKFGLFFLVNRRNALKKWTFIFSAVIARLMWKRFIERSLRPDSRFMFKFAKRAQRAFKMN
jgi:hypothetical protein